MSNRKLSTYVIDLIKGLNTTEKKHFRVYARRNAKERELKSLQLFDFIEKTEHVTNDVIYKKFPDLNHGQINELKGRLYEQLLISLRLLNRQEIDLNIREKIDWAAVLYSKDLFNQSLSILEKAKKTAQQWHKETLLFEIVEFEKRIETKHIMNGCVERLNHLNTESAALNSSIITQGMLSNLYGQLTCSYLKNGHINNIEEYNKTKILFEANTSEINEDQLSFYGKITMYQSFLTYYFNGMNFDKALLYACKWITMFEKEPNLIKADPELYIKGLTSSLDVLFRLKDHVRFVKYFKQLEQFVNENEDSLDKNLASQSFHDIELARINLFLLEGKYDEGVQFLNKFINSSQLSSSINKDLDFELNYKIALLYFGIEDYKNTVKYLNLIVNVQDNSYRIDIQAFARILLLIAHFELGNLELVSYQIKSVSRFLESNHEINKTHQLVLKFLQKHLNSNKKQLTAGFVDLNDKFSDIVNDPFEKRFLNYFDLASWIESKIRSESMQTTVENKFKLLQSLNEVINSSFFFNTKTIAPLKTKVVSNPIESIRSIAKENSQLN